MSAPMQEIITKKVDKLTYYQSPILLESIQARLPDSTQPRGISTAGPGDQLNFIIENDQFIDLRTVTLDFTLSFPTTSTIDDGCHISNAADIISKIDIFYNDTNVESITEANKWCNAFIAHSANDSWVNSEGNMLIGYTAPNASPWDAQGGASIYDINYNRARSYSIPLCLLSGFMRGSWYLPLLGNKLRIQLTMAPREQVISYAGDLASTVTYSVSNVNLNYDCIITTTQHKQMMLEAMNSRDGLRIPYTTLQTSIQGVVASTSNTIRIQHNLSNMLSLFLLHDNISDKTLVAQKWNMHCQSFPLSNYSSLRVKCGTQFLTNSNDLNSFTQLYCAAEKCVGSFANLQGSGFIDWPTYTRGYTANRVFPDGEYGLCLIGINLEKSLEADDGVANSGLSSNSNGSSKEFELLLRTSTTLSASNQFLTAIAHKRALVFSGPRGVQVDL